MEQQNDTFDASEELKRAFNEFSQDVAQSKVFITGEVAIAGINVLGCYALLFISKMLDRKYAEFYEKSDFELTETERKDLETLAEFVVNKYFSEHFILIVFLASLTGIYAMKFKTAKVLARMRAEDERSRDEELIRQQMQIEAENIKNKIE